MATGGDPTGEQLVNSSNHGNPDMLSSVISEEFLTCKICFDKLERPKILDCLHSFCHQCLSDHVIQNDLVDLLPCPLCRQRTPIPNGVQDLKDNFLLMSLQDAIVFSSNPEEDDAEEDTISLRGRECDSCKSRGEQRLCQMKCLDCDEYLCEECIQAHQRLNLTKHHKTVSLEELSQTSTSSENQINRAAESVQIRRCSIHADEECQLYCEPCHSVICVTCRLTTHDGHKCCTFDEAAATEKQELHRWLDFIQSRIDKYEGILSDWHKYGTDLERQQSSTQEAIDHRCQQLHTLVDGWHYATSKQLEAVIKDENKQLLCKTDKVEVCLATNKGLHQLTQTILHHTTPLNFLTLRPQLVQDLHKLQRENLNALCHTQRSVFSFVRGQKMLNFDNMGSFILSQEKVMSGVQLRPVQNLTFVSSFSTREQTNGSRFDASAIFADDRDQVIITDRQMDRISIRRPNGMQVSQLNVSLMGKPIFCLATPTRDLVFTRDKQSICVFNEVGQHKFNLKEYLSKPCSLTIGPEGFLFVLDHETKIVTKISTQTYTKISHVKLGYKKGSVWDKIGINSQGNIYLSAFAENCIYEFTALGQKLAEYGRWGSRDAGDLYWPRGMCVDAHDNIIVADTNNSRLQMLTPQGSWMLLETPQVHGVTNPTDVAITSKGHLCVLQKCGKVLVYQYLPY